MLESEGGIIELHTSVIVYYLIMCTLGNCEPS